MKIGIDIDNVISNFNDVLLHEYIIYDKQLRNTGIINKNASYIRKGMFDWTNDEELNFYHNNIERIAKNLDLVVDSKKYIDKLKNLGNKIYIITGRDNGEYSDPYNMTKNWLDNNNIAYDELILTNAYKHHEKADICLEKNIDVMIDDSVHVCEECSNKNVDTLLFSTIYNKSENRFERANSWKAVYDYIVSKQKFNIILDTDTNNECDDLFALSYLLKSKDKFNLEAVTIAPYSHKNETNISKGIDLSFNVCKDIFKLCDENNSNMIFKGSTDYFQNGYLKENDAINRMKQIINKNQTTYLLCIGAITNVAVLLKLYPEIKDKIKVIWLGGHELNYKDNMEYNFKQDIDAVKYVFDSEIDLTIIPCKGVTDALKINIYELQKHLDITTGLGKYLYDKFYNDGYHGITEERVIWDISVIAYMINRNWFETNKISCPTINHDTSYSKTENKHNIIIANHLDAVKIYADLFSKLGV